MIKLQQSQYKKYEDTIFSLQVRIEQMTQKLKPNGSPPANGQNGEIKESKALKDLQAENAKLV
jgi:hypothetical protein